MKRKLGKLVCAFAGHPAGVCTAIGDGLIVQVTCPRCGAFTLLMRNDHPVQMSINLYKAGFRRTE